MTEEKGNNNEKTIELKPLRELVSIKEAAKLFGLSEHYIRRACARGELPYIQIGNRNKLIDVGLMDEALTMLANRNKTIAAERYERYLEEKYPLKLHNGVLCNGRR